MAGLGLHEFLRSSLDSQLAPQHQGLGDGQLALCSLPNHQQSLSDKPANQG
jgi:hypothetical protein